MEKPKYVFTPTILFYPCNLVSLIRFGLIVKTWYGLHLLSDNTANLWGQLAIVGLLGSCASLDLLDGYLARKFNQTTAFGAILDQVVDLTMHTTFWIISGFWLTPIVLTLEWITGLAVIIISLNGQSKWKRRLLEANMPFIDAYFYNNQRNLLSTVANISHLVFPAALYLDGPFFWIAYFASPGVLLYEVATIIMLIILLRGFYHDIFRHN